MDGRRRKTTAEMGAIAQSSSHINRNIPKLSGTRKGRSKRAGKKKNPSFRARLIRLLFPPFLAVFVLSGAVLIYYHGKFSRWIDALLIENDPVSRIVLARPFSIKVGQQYSLAGLIRHLERVGYDERASKVGRWRRHTSGVVEFGSESEYFSAGFNAGRLTRLTRNGLPLKELQLPPAFLSSMSFHTRKKRKPLSFDAYPKDLINSVLAAEDTRFFQHKGIDLMGLTRATIVNLMHRQIRQGGSTLTQQFAKNYFFSQQRSWKRKGEEILMALMLEQRLTKRQIFELYANEVYLGQVGSFAMHGLGQGALVFFGKECRELTLAQAAAIAAMIPSPNRLSPYRHGNALESRRNRILDRMSDLGMISAREISQAKKESLQVIPSHLLDSTNAPHFVDHLSSRLTSDLGLNVWEPVDLEIQSTLDLDLQHVAFTVMQSGLQRIEQSMVRSPHRPNIQGAFIAVDPLTGDILALIGGRDYARGQYNRATRSLRQPGSTFKPFAYATAFEVARKQNRSTEMTLSTAISDTPYTLHYGSRTYRPSNYRDRYFGTVSVRQALANSLNIPAVRVAEWAGFDQIQELSEAVGFGVRMKPYPSIVLGSQEVSLLELAQGYQVLANEGVKMPLRLWNRVTLDGEGLQIASNVGSRIISAETAFFITSALESVLEEGTARKARAAGFTLPAAGKTGSTTDSWFVGYTPDLLCLVWVGTDQAPHLNLSGSAAALPIWIDFMKTALSLGKLSGEGFRIPAGIRRLLIDPASGLKANRDCTEKRIEYYLPGAEPSGECRTHGFQQSMLLGEKTVKESQVSR